MDKKSMKLDLLKQLQKAMAEEGNDNIAGQLQSVKVAAKDKEGLVKGLDTAKEIVEKGPLASGLANKSVMSDEVSEEDNANESSEECDMSQDEIKAKIAELQAKLSK